MSKAYASHFTFDSKIPGERPLGRDISNYIPVQDGRDGNEDEDFPEFDVLQWLSNFYGQKVPPLPVINHDTDIDKLPDQTLQQTMEEYQIETPTVKKRRLNPFTEIGVSGFPLIEETRFNIIRSYPADEQYHGHQNLIWLISNSYYRAVAWCVYGNWEFWPHVKAQHRTYVNRVLENKNHPRNFIYKDLNRARKGRNKLNLKERLGIPYCAIRHEDIQQVTADLYGIFLVVFTYQPKGHAIMRDGVKPNQAEQHYAPAIRGDFNRPHKFIRLSIGTMPKKYQKYPNAERIPMWQIYEPMITDLGAKIRPWDFKYVRPSFENTRKSLPDDATKEEFDGYRHPWRRVFGETGAIPGPLTHPPRVPRGIPVPMKEDIDIATGCTHGTDPDDLEIWDKMTPMWIRRY